MKNSLNLDQKIGDAYISRDFSGLADLDLLDAICRIETLGKNMPAAMLGMFRKEAEKRGLVGALDLTQARAPGYRAAGVTRAEYDNARKLISDNGRYALRFLPERVRLVLLATLESKPDQLAEKAASLFHKPGQVNPEQWAPALWNKEANCAEEFGAYCGRVRAAFFTHVCAESLAKINRERGAR